MDKCVQYQEAIISSLKMLLCNDLSPDQLGFFIKRIRNSHPTLFLDQAVKDLLGQAVTEIMSKNPSTQSLIRLLDDVGLIDGIYTQSVFERITKNNPSIDELFSLLSTGEQSITSEMKKDTIALILSLKPNVEQLAQLLKYINKNDPNYSIVEQYIDLNKDNFPLDDLAYFADVNLAWMKKKIWDNISQFSPDSLVGILRRSRDGEIINFAAKRLAFRFSDEDLLMEVIKKNGVKDEYKDKAARKLVASAKGDLSYQTIEIIIAHVPTLWSEMVDFLKEKNSFSREFIQTLIEIILTNRKLVRSKNPSSSEIDLILTSLMTMRNKLAEIEYSIEDFFRNVESL